MATVGGDIAAPDTKRRSRQLPALLVPIVLAALLAGWYFLAGALVGWLTSRDIDNFVLRTREGSDQIATNLARNMQDEVRRLANIPEALEGDLVLRAPLVGRQEGSARAAVIAQANERLAQLADQVEVDLLYLLDTNGLCVAASNYQLERSVVGIDLHSRQYFIAIQNGGRGRQFAFGTGTATPGVYFSSAIKKDGEFAGGVVVKRNIRSLFHLTSRNPALLVDEYGVVVATTSEQTLWHYLPDSAAVGLGTDFLQDRYRQSAISPVDIRADRSLEAVSLVHLMGDPIPSLMTARPIGDSGLRLVYFTPVPELTVMRQRAGITFWLLFATGCLMLTVVAGGATYALQSRRRVAALRYSYQQLSSLSRELAAEKETALAADRAKSRFLAAMSHELRTPFSGILGTIELLRASSLPTEAVEHVGLIDRSARALLGVLNDILDFSKIDTGHLTVEKIPFELKGVVEDVWRLHSQVTLAKGLGLKVEGLDGEIVGLGDPDRLRQILNNFLSNAVKFTAMGTIRLQVTLTGAGEGRRLTISVTDSGIGMSPEIQMHLFEPFFQADASTSRRHGGTGLGLAICRSLAESMGGAVGASSEQGQGATFWLEIPFPENDGRPAAASSLPAAKPIPTLAPQPAPGRRILLADDDEVNRLVVGGMLRRLGHDVILANDGRQAVLELTRQEFDLVIMDMHMPEMDGVEATRAIRTLQTVKGEVPIIGLTADAIVENRAGYLASGLNDLLTKPISAPELADIIRRFTEPAV